MKKEGEKFNPSEHLIDLKGKAYLQVMWRIVWMREEHPEWGVSTELVERGTGFAIFKATVSDESNKIISTGFGSETATDFKDYLEKAETKAIGRALALAGFGTQFSPELDEGERIVDAPVAKSGIKKFDPYEFTSHQEPMSIAQRNLIDKLAVQNGVSKDELNNIAKAVIGKNYTDFSKKDAMQFIRDNCLGNSSVIGTAQAHSGDMS